MGAPPFASVVDIKYQLADQIPDQDGKYIYGFITRNFDGGERREDDIVLIKQWAILNVFWMVWAEPHVGLDTGLQ